MHTEYRQVLRCLICLILIYSADVAVVTAKARQWNSFIALLYDPCQRCLPSCFKVSKNII